MKAIMKDEQLDLSNIKMTHMAIGNENGWIADVDLTKPCEGDDCVSISYQKDGTMLIK